MASRGVFICGTDTGVGKTTVSAGLLRALVRQGLAGVRGWKPVVSGAVQLVETEPVGRNVVPRDDDPSVARGGLTAVTDVDDGEAGSAGTLASRLCWRWEDLERLTLADQAAIPAKDRAWVRLRSPAAPAFAAAREGVALDVEALKAWCADKLALSGYAVVEGVGGLLVPVTPSFDMADLAVALRLPCVLVVGIRLGCINHALLTGEALRARGVPLSAWVANLGLDVEYGFIEQTLEAIAAGLGQPCAARLPWLPGSDELRPGQDWESWRRQAERQIAGAAAQLEDLAAALRPVGP